MKISPETIGYTFAITKKTIEIPKKHRNKAIAVACASVAEFAGGLGFTAAGIATKDPIFTGVGLSIFGHIAGSIAMLKGSLWDFAGNFYKNHVNDMITNIKKIKPNVTSKEIQKFEEGLKL